jgi:peptide deformylase
MDILLLGNPELRKKAERIKNIDDRNIQNLINDMLTKVIEANGMGLAATQLGKHKQMFIMASHPNERYPYAPSMEPTAILNPEILATSVQTEKGWEGCLSVPGLRGLVSRFTGIEVRYQTAQGETIECRFEGFLARIFQHEYDHLQGKVFVDRVASSEDLMVEAEWQKLMQSGQV